MKETLTKFLPLIIFGIQTSLCFVEVRSYLGIDDPDILIPIVGLVFILYLLNHYLTFLKPYQKYKRFEATKELMIDKQVEDLISVYKDKGIPLRVNIMTINRKFVSFIEPGVIFGRKICFFRRHLRPVWVSKNMDHVPDKNLCLTIRQGVAGIAVRNQKPIFAVFDKKDEEIYNLNKEQLAKTQEVKTIYSFPLRDINKKTRRVSDRIIGTVNVDSLSDQSLKLKEDSKLLNSLAKKTQALAENCSMII